MSGLAFAARGGFMLFVDYNRKEDEVTLAITTPDDDEMTVHLSPRGAKRLGMFLTGYGLRLDDEDPGPLDGGA